MKSTNEIKVNINNVILINKSNYKNYMLGYNQSHKCRMAINNLLLNAHDPTIKCCSELAQVVSVNDFICVDES